MAQVDQAADVSDLSAKAQLFLEQNQLLAEFWVYQKGWRYYLDTGYNEHECCSQVGCAGGYLGGRSTILKSRSLSEGLGTAMQLAVQQGYPDG